MPLCLGCSRSVRTSRMAKSDWSAHVVHTFWPVTIHSSPSRSALHASDATGTSASTHASVAATASARLVEPSIATRATACHQARRALRLRGQAHVLRSCLAALGGPLGPRLASLDSSSDSPSFEPRVALLAEGAEAFAEVVAARRQLEGEGLVLQVALEVDPAAAVEQPLRETERDRGSGGERLHE